MSAADGLISQLARSAPRLSCTKNRGRVDISIPKTFVASVHVEELRSAPDEEEQRELWAWAMAAQLLHRADRRLRGDQPHESHRSWHSRVRWGLFRLAWRSLWSGDHSSIFNEAMGLLTLRALISPEAPARWRNVRRCVSCSERLTENEVFYSDGRCPRCGHKGDPGTVVRTTEHAEEE